MSRRGWSRGARETYIEARGGLDVRRLFSAYYALSPPIKEPSMMKYREFAFQPFDIESYVRHISFNSREELVKYLASNPPRHAYYSVALYEVPDAPDMDSKGWMGSELMFDIDVDHFEGCRHAVDDECLLQGFEYARKLLRLLERDFSVRGRAYFTGNRGFHVLVSCDWCLKLGKEERRELARYVLLEGLDISLLVNLTGKGLTAVKLLSEDDPGPRWRIAAELKSLAEGVGGEALGREALEEAARRASIPIDFQVTQDIYRLARIEGTLNAKAGLLVTPVDVTSGFRPGEELSPFRGELTVRAVRGLGETSILGTTIGFSEGETITLPAHIGVYLYLKGYVEVVGGGVVVRAGAGWRAV